MTGIKNKFAFLLLILAVMLYTFVTIANAQKGAEDLVKETETGGFGALEIIKDWRVITVLTLAVTAALIAFTFMFGQAFEMPDLKAWASVEFTQAIVTAIIVVCLFIALTFLDTLLVLIVNNAIPGQCEPADQQLCAIKTADTYISSLVDVAVEDSKAVFAESIKSAREAGERFGFNCASLWCLWYGTSIGINPHLMLDVERASLELEQYQVILSSLYAQQFFVSEVAFKIAPIILALGIVARTFFLTRKLGGLLLAAGLGVMFVFPLMYVFDWWTLNITLFGERMLEPGEPTICPAECKLSPPIAYAQGTNTVYSTLDKLTEINGVSIEDAIALKNGDVAQISRDGKTLISCQYTVDHSHPLVDDGITCPTGCREIPYPGTSAICSSRNVQQVCNKYLPRQCKVDRTIKDPEPNLDSVCPQVCKTIPPMKYDCYTGNPECVNVSRNCRVALKDDLDWRPEECNDDADTCPASFDPSQSCVYVIPSVEGSCDQLCSSCPRECRISGPTGTFGQPLPTTLALPSKCNTFACHLACPSACKVPEAALATATECAGPNEVSNFDARTDNCALAPYACRIKNYDYTSTTDINQYACANDQKLFEEVSQDCSISQCKVNPAPITSECLAYEPNAEDANQCKKCPLSCRFKSNDPEKDCSDFSEGRILDLTDLDCSIQACPDTCRVEAPPINAQCKEYDYKYCDLCPLRCRVLLPDGSLPSGCPAQECSELYCPKAYCKQPVPLEPCQQCIKADKSYTYSPPVRTNCQALCGDKSQGSFSGVSPGEFTKKSAEGMIGREDIKNVSKMVLPAYMLPLLNILVTVMFIKTFSPIFGGDIEIPGLPKIL